LSALDSSPLDKPVVALATVTAKHVDNILDKGIDVNVHIDIDIDIES